jgi:hypothetical protein
MKILTWIKSQRWAVTAAMILGAIALALAGAKSAKRSMTAKRKDAMAVDLMNSAIGSDLKRAGKLIKSAEKDKQRARDAKDTIKYKLGELTKVNDDLDSIVNDFNSRRVRRSGKT